MNSKIFHSIILFLLLVVAVNAQQTIIHVVDDKSNEACSYANVVLTDFSGKILHGGVSNNEGKIKFDLNQKAIIAVSFLGYEKLSDTITPGQTLTVRMITDHYEVEQVVITGQYKAKPVDQSIYKIDVVNAKAMQERGVNNLAEALSNETSIRLKVDPSTGTSIRLQGMGGENIKYLIDGVPLIGRVAGDIDLSQINMENIDHIEIVQGPMSVQYGTSAIAGVINIITKKNNYYNNLLKFNSFTDTKGNYNFGAFGSIIRGNHTFSLSGNRNMFQGVDIDMIVDTADADGHNRYMEFKPKRVYNADASYAFRKKDLRIDVKSQFMNSFLRNYSNYIEKVVLAYDNDFHTSRSTNSINVTNKASESLSYNITAAYTWFGRQTDNITSDLYLLTKELTGTSSTTFQNIMTRGNISIAPPGKNWSAMTGYDINIDEGKGDKLEEDASIGDYALYASGQYSPLKNVSLQPGVRFIYNTIYGAPIIPSFNLQWTIIDKLNYRASYARGFRAPSLKELYLDFKDSNHNLSGNTDLKAETTNSYNTSLNYTLNTSGGSRIKLESGFFYNNGQDAISLIVTDASSNAATNVNIGGRRTLGGEFHGSHSHSSGLFVGLGFSRIGETIDNEGEGEYLPIIYYNNYSLNTRYSIPKINTILVANIKYYGQTPVLAAIPESDGGGYYRVSTAAFGDVELTLSKNFWKNKISLVLGAKNLLNNYEGITSGYIDYDKP
ncbi:MAG: TonB-dependent receptor, partial [Bacteroidales bacterium]|nr:TonB-dependent receptor [Bacteroidales bacterium]